MTKAGQKKGWTNKRQAPRNIGAKAQITEAIEMANYEICWMNASDLARAIAVKKLSPVEVVKAILERIEVINPKINAYVTVTADLAMDMARAAEEAVMKKKKLGLLHGVPFSVKDVTFTKGIRTTMGSQLMEDHIPEEDAVHVARLKQAGAIPLGKTNTPEFAAKGVTENLLFGTTRNQELPAVQAAVPGRRWRLD
jgi:Asp-tRNA(Asn)/Glu-tRNA(Gln) amidotransferase A subunit family amidase